MFFRQILFCLFLLSFSNANEEENNLSFRFSLFGNLQLVNSKNNRIFPVSERRLRNLIKKYPYLEKDFLEKSKIENKTELRAFLKTLVRRKKRVGESSIDTFRSLYNSAKLGNNFFCREEIL